MKTTPLLLLVAAGCLAWATACQPTQENKPQTDATTDSLQAEAELWENAQEINPEPELPLPVRLSALNDSVETTWRDMVKSDEGKLQNILRLANQIAKYPKHNRTLLDSLKSLHQQLSSQKLTWESMAAPGQIDRYDHTFEQLMAATTRLRETTAGIESCTACTDMYSDIQASYDNDATLRVRYNGFVRDLNLLLDAKKDSVALLGGKYALIKRRPLFIAGQATGAAQ